MGKPVLPPAEDASDVSGLILAGGRGRRMQPAAASIHDARPAGATDAAGNAQAGTIHAGGHTPPVEKGLLLLHDRPLVAWAARTMPAGLAALYISANRCRAGYAPYGHVVPDDPLLGTDCGPLAGIASAMRVMTTAWVFTAPADVPSVPRDLYQRLRQHIVRTQSPLVYVSTQRAQPLFMLAHITTHTDLLRRLRQGDRKVQAWQQAHGQALQLAAASHEFFNINTPQDLARAHELIVSPAGGDPL